MSKLNLKKTKSKQSKSSFSKSFAQNNDYNDYNYDFDENDLKGEVTYEDINFQQEKDISEERDKIISSAVEKLFLEKPQVYQQ